GKYFASLLKDYFVKRGLPRVPKTALMTMPIVYEDSEISSHEPGMVLPVRNADGKLQGIAVTWLDVNLTGKSNSDPNRQSYGTIKGNFVTLSEIDWKNPPETLLIGEGVETVLT